MALADPTSLILVFSGLISLAWLRAGLVRGSRRERALPVLIFYALCSAGWAAAAALSRLQELRLLHGFDLFALAQLELYFLLGQAVGFYQLTRQFCRQPLRFAQIWLPALIFVGGSIFLYANPLRLPAFLPVSAGYGVQLTQAAFAVIVTGWAGFLGSALVLTRNTIRREVVPLHRNRSQYWAFAALFEALAHMLMLARQPFAGGLLHILAGTLLAVTLRTYALPDLRSVLRRASAYIATVLVSASLYAGLYYGALRVLRLFSVNNPLLAGVLLALLIAVSLPPLWNGSRRMLQRWIFGARYDARQIVSSYSQSISNILDFDLLATSAIGQVRAVLHAAHGALIVAHRGTYTDMLLPYTGDGAAPHALHLSAGNPAAQAWQAENRPLTQYEIDILPRFQSMDAADRAALAALGMDLFVPIVAKQQWIGLLALGPRTTGERYYDDDLALLQTLADQTAVALENARLYADLKQRNQENERLNVDLQEANTELAHLDQAKADFISIASHELRTPLTQVIGYNDILLEWTQGDRLDPESAQKMLQAARRAARRLEEIVDTMLDVSKLEARSLELSCARVSLQQVVEEAAERWAVGMQERNLTLNRTGLETLPPLIGDHKRLVQVFRQLIQNAIKSTPDGGQILLSGRVVNEIEDPAAPGYLEVVVEDRGIGIAPEELERIFVKFYRVGNVLLHSSGDTKFKGAGPGLGLTIARGIVEAHGGKIWAESPGFDEQALPGAKFHVLLPLNNPALTQYL